MSHLRVYSDINPAKHEVETNDRQIIKSLLHDVGVRFELWNAECELHSDATEQDVLKAYKSSIEKLQQENGYQAVDVLRMFPDHPQREAFRQKFLNEHTHSEDEVRFFVEGSGLFFLHIKGKVYATLCEKGDLISVPDGVTHWFDMGEKPYFTVLRLFSNVDGWVANFTGDTIAQRFPKFGE